MVDEKKPKELLEIAIKKFFSDNIGNLETQARALDDLCAVVKPLDASSQLKRNFNEIVDMFKQGAESFREVICDSFFGDGGYAGYVLRLEGCRIKSVGVAGQRLRAVDLTTVMRGELAI